MSDAAFMLGEPLSFRDLPGWEGDNHAEAFAAFQKSARLMQITPPKTRGLAVSGRALQDISKWLAHLDEGTLEAESRLFFETYFTPRLIKPSGQAPKEQRGFVTGYYEPEVPGSRTRNSRYTIPLLRRPSDLVEISDLPADQIPAGWDTSLRFGRQHGQTITPYFDRAAIEQGALDGQNLELVFLEDPIDAFFIHIQGSARIRLEDGAVMRVTYAAKNGHPYTPIGRLLIEQNAISREAMSMAAIRQWLMDHQAQQAAIMAHNRSFIFFEEVHGLRPEDGPIGAAKVPLSAKRSLAIDRLLHTMGTPIFLDAALDIPFRHLMIAQDTGSAIVGPARGDIYFGSGDTAAHIAGAIQHPADFYMLWPKHQPI